MGFLDHFRARHSGGAKRRSIADNAHWEVLRVDFCRALGALPELAPAGSLLGLAEGAWPADVRDNLDDHGVTLDALVLATLPEEFEGARYLPIDKSTMRRLVELAGRHASMELGIHLVVLHEGVALVEWYDLPQGPIAIRSSVPEAVMARFAVAAGGRHPRHNPPKEVGPRRRSHRAQLLVEKVDEHGRMLRGLSFEELRQRSEPAMSFEIEGRPATIDTDVQTRGSEVRVVVYGRLEAWIGVHVALHAFYKAEDGGMRDMPEEELDEELEVF